MKEKIIDAETYWIIINNKGIFKLTKKRYKKRELLSGRFRIIKYIPKINSFIISINKHYLCGTVDYLIIKLISYKYSNSNPSLRLIFETYKKEERN